MKVTKKAIRAAIKAEDLTKICHCYVRMGNTIPKDRKLYFIHNFICEYVPNFSFSKFLDMTDEHDRLRSSCDRFYVNKGKMLKWLRKLMTEDLSSYSKVPMLGRTHLYFCSPYFGFTDYNKWRGIEIKGNEEFCNKVLELGERIYQKKVAAVKEAV